MNRFKRYSKIVIMLLTLFLPCQRLALASDSPDTNGDAPAEVSESIVEQLLPVEEQQVQAFSRTNDGTLEFHARNLDIVSALTQLRLLEERNIVVSNKVEGTISADLYGLNFEEALSAILRASGLVASQEGPFIYVHTAEEAKQLASEAAKLIIGRRRTITHIFHLYYASAPEVIGLLRPLASEQGNLAATSASEKGIAANTEAAGGNNFAATDTIVVSDYPENIEQMKRVVAKVDIRPRQVMIEATILTASLREDNALGIDFNVLAGVDFRQMGGTSPSGTSMGLGNVPAAELDGGMGSAHTDFISGLGITPGGAGLNIGILKNGIGLFIQALEQITDTTVLANPKVLVLNKQRGEVMVGRRDGYVTTTTTETSTVETVEFLETGTRLIFRPYVGNDGYVRLEIHPEDSTGGLTADNLPFEETAEVTTNVLVKDGSTIVIGGLFRDNMLVKRGQAPWLGNIPVVGALFRRTRDDSTRQEVIILLTPHIIEDPASENDEDLLADTEAIRVGSRQGLQWHGRERLAQGHYRSARKYIESGDKTRALCELNAAINLFPSFLDAIKLREELLQKKLAEPTGSAIRDLIANRITKPQRPSEQSQRKGLQ